MTLLVGHKVGVFSDFSKAADRIIKIKEVIRPVKEWADVYDKLYPYYIEMYRNLDESLKNLKETVNSMNK